MVDAGAADTPRRKAEVAGLDDPSSPAKKRRGRPRKSDRAGQAAVPSPATANGTPKKQVTRRKKADLFTGSQGVDASLVGQPVHGFLDGTFDAGYILTVRVGDTDTILRGVIFGPGLSVPVTDANDIAPNVKFADGSSADDITLRSPSPFSSPAPGSSSQQPQQNYEQQQQQNHEERQQQKSHEERQKDQKQQQNREQDQQQQQPEVSVALMVPASTPVVEAETDSESLSQPKPNQQQPGNYVLPPVAPEDYGAVFGVQSAAGGVDTAATAAAAAELTTTSKDHSYPEHHQHPEPTGAIREEPV